MNTFLRRACTLAALALATSSLAAQAETDPRYGEDPRETADPRGEEDPRDQQPDPRDISPKFGEHVDALLDEDHDVPAARDIGLEGWSVEPIVGGLVDKWLAAATFPEGQLPTANQLAKAEDLRSRGAQLAWLADQSLRDTRFAHWVETVHGWSAAERRRYAEAEELRELGNKQLRDVTSALEALTTLTTFSQALAHYRALGDTRRIAEVHATMGDIHAENGHVPEAVDHLTRAEQLGREIKSVDTVEAALTSLELLMSRTENYDELLDILDRQVTFATERRDARTAQHTLARQLKLAFELDGQGARIVTLDPDAESP